MYQNDLTDIQAVPSIPPESLQAEYSYNPMPADIIPPIGPNLLLHFYDHPDHLGVLPTVFKKIPKKLRTRLAPCPIKGCTVGWGIQIVESFNWGTIFPFSTLGFLLCMVFGFAWAAIKKDVQGGFGVASFLLAFVLFCGGFVHTNVMLTDISKGQGLQP
jgi:hypothetical protein